MNKVRRSIVVYVVVLAAVAIVAWQLLDRGAERKSLDLDAFQQPARRRQGRHARRSSTRTTCVQGELRDGTEYEVHFPEGYTEQITNDIVAADVELRRRRPADEPVARHPASASCRSCSSSGSCSVRPEPGAGRRRGSWASASRGRRRSRRTSRRTTFADVAGLDEAVEELQEIKDFLEAPAKFEEMGAKIPKGVLLFGPPGPARRCSPRRSPARRACRSSRSAAPTSSRCSSASAHPASATSSSRRRRRRPRSCSSTRSTPSAATAAPASAAATTSASRR